MNFSGHEELTQFESQALTHMFDGFATRKLRYGVLRNFENLPVSLNGTDVDILVHPDDLPAALHVIAETARSIGAHYAKAYHDDMITQIVLVKRSHPTTIMPLKIDLLHNRQIQGIQFLDAETMLSDLRTHNGVSVVSEMVMLLDKWLFHLLLGVPLPAKYDADFAAIARGKTGSISGNLARFLPQSRATELVTALTEEKGSTIVLEPLERWRALARAWVAQGLAALPRSVRFLGFRLRDLLYPQGIFLSVSGPDGSGKTTVIDMVLTQLRAIYGDSAVYYAHFRPTMLPRIAEVAKKTRAVETVDEDYDRPHRAKPSGLIGSAARLGYYWLDYMGGYFRSVHPVLRRREVMLFDRYYFDMIADSFRSRIALPLPLLLTIGRILPLPRYAFFINVEPEEIHRRKQELTVEQIVALNERYNNLVQRGWLIRINNNGAPEEASAAIVDRIIADRHAQAARRLR